MLTEARSPLGFVEFISIMALMIALTALSIDAMLPALTEIGLDLSVRNANDTQLVISVIFLGTAMGQLVCGPLSDSYGRKPLVFVGITIFIIGSLLCIFTTEFSWMLWGRLLQGIGLGAPRVISTAIIRDLYQGREMARVMSYVMTMFILAPVLAPALGQLILFIASWRMIFTMLLIMGLLILFWFMVRQPETLPSKQRARLSVQQLKNSLNRVLLNPITLGYTITAGLISGPFVAFLSSIQQILQLQYGLGTLFPLFFAGLSIAVGSASLLNARLVIRIGMRSMVRRALITMSTAVLIYGMFAFYLDGHPPLWSFMVFLSTTLFCTGILFGNLNALAMEPLGKIAGIGAAITSSFATFISVPIGMFIGLSYNGTVLPLIVGFGICSLTAIIIQHLTETRRNIGITRR